MDKTAKALLILRNSSALEKEGGVISGTVDLVRAVDRAGQAASSHLSGKGMRGAALLARVAPHAAVAYGGKKVYDSEPVQRLRAKIQEYKYNRALKRAQQQGY